MVTLKDWLDTWIGTYIAPKRAQNTVNAYGYALVHLSSALMHTPIDELDPLALQREINTLGARYPRQAQLLFIALRASLKKAVMLRLIERSPMELVENVPHHKREMMYLTPEEATRYVKNAHLVAAAPLLLLMLLCGLRRNEARAVTKAAIDQDNVLHIRHQKIGCQLRDLKTYSSIRDIPLAPELADKLRSMYWPTEISETTLRRQHLRVMRAAGIEKNVTLHGLRHSCAMLAQEDGEPLQVIQKLLGHSHFTTTADIYLHTDIRLLLAASQRLYQSVYQVGKTVKIG